MRLLGRNVVVATVVALALAAGCGPEKKKPVRSEDPVRHYQIGMEYLRQGRPDRALVSLEEASRLDAESPLIGYALGLAYMGIRDYPRAEKAFLHVLDVDPFFSDAHNSLGIVYGELGEPLKARAEFERVLGDQRYPTPEVAHFNLGALLYGQGRVEESLGHLKTAAETKPQNSAWRYQYGFALEKLDRLEEARREYEAAIEAKSDFLEALYRLGLLYVRLKEVDKARQSLERVIQLAPRSDLATESSRVLAGLGAG